MRQPNLRSAKRAKFAPNIPLDRLTVLPSDLWRHIFGYVSSAPAYSQALAQLRGVSKRWRFNIETFLNMRLRFFRTSCPTVSLIKPYTHLAKLAIHAQALKGVRLGALFKAIQRPELVTVEFCQLSMKLFTRVMEAVARYGENLHAVHIQCINCRNYRREVSLMIAPSVTSLRFESPIEIRQVQFPPTPGKKVTLDLQSLHLWYSRVQDVESFAQMLEAAKGSLQHLTLPFNVALFAKCTSMRLCLKALRTLRFACHPTEFDNTTDFSFIRLLFPNLEQLMFSSVDAYEHREKGPEEDGVQLTLNWNSSHLLISPERFYVCPAALDRLVHQMQPDRLDIVCSWNFFSWRIRPPITPSLKYLRLQNAGMEDLQILTDALREFSNLKSLRLESWDLAEWCNFASSSLKQLYVSGSNLSTEMLEHLWHACPELKVCHFQAITGVSEMHLHGRMLEKFMLRNSNVDDISYDTNEIPKLEEVIVENCPNLQVFKNQELTQTYRHVSNVIYVAPIVVSFK